MSEIETTKTPVTVDEAMKAAIADLVAAQSEFRPAVMDSTVIYSGRPSKYASLKAVLDACLPALHRHGFALLFSVTTENGNLRAVVRLLHKGGACIESEPFVVPTGNASARMNAQQAHGSASTYARRYALSAFLAISADEDDDGNAADYEHSAAVQSNRSRSSVPPPPVQVAEGSPELEARAEAAARKGLKAYQEFYQAAGKAGRVQLQSRHEEFKRIAKQADDAFLPE